MIRMIQRGDGWYDDVWRLRLWLQYGDKVVVQRRRSRIFLVIRVKIRLDG